MGHVGFRGSVTHQLAKNRRRGLGSGARLRLQTGVWGRWGKWLFAKYDAGRRPK